MAWVYEVWGRKVPWNDEAFCLDKEKASSEAARLSTKYACKVYVTRIRVDADVADSLASGLGIDAARALNGGVLRSR